MKLAERFGRADWVRSQLFYTTLRLICTIRSRVWIDEVKRSLYKSLQPWTWIEGNRMYASFGHLTGYSSNYYTYPFDKVIALDFFGQFDATDLLGCDAGARYRTLVLEQGGSKRDVRWCATSWDATRSLQLSRSGSTTNLTARFSLRGKGKFGSGSTARQSRLRRV